MTSLASLGDPAAVANFYSDRRIVMVEGASDKQAFERIVGPGYDADIVFRVAPTGAGYGGCKAVRDRVSEERKANSKVFGLLDGEAAASADGTQALLENQDVLFTLPTSDGLIYLGAHEIENLYFEFANVCDAIAHHRPVSQLGNVTGASIAASIDDNLGHFLTAAYCKYASAYFHNLGQMRGIVNTKIFGGATARQLIPTLRAMVLSGSQISWQDFKRKAREVRAAGEAILAARSYDEAQAKRWKLRVADGKELLARIRGLHGNVGTAIEGHLLKEVCASAYSEMFRTHLFGLIGYNPA